MEGGGDKPAGPTDPGRPRAVTASVVASLKIILGKDTSLILWLAGCNYAAWYCVSAALPGIYASVYGWSEVAIGLAYLPGALALLVGGFLNGPLAKRRFARTAAEAGLPADAHAVEHAFPIERARGRGLWAVLGRAARRAGGPWLGRAGARAPGRVSGAAGHRGLCAVLHVRIVQHAAD